MNVASLDIGSCFWKVWAWFVDAGGGGVALFLGESIGWSLSLRPSVWKRGSYSEEFFCGKGLG